MQGLLKMSGLIDRMNHGIGKAMTWLVLIVVVVSAGNAVVRYAFNWSSNSLLEIQWYLFSAIVMFSAGYVLLKNEHIRIDVIVGRFSQRAQNWVDVFGLIVFLLPMMLITLYFSWPSFTNAWASGEMSAHRATSTARPQASGQEKRIRVSARGPTAVAFAPWVPSTALVDNQPAPRPIPGPRVPAPMRRGRSPVMSASAPSRVNLCCWASWQLAPEPSGIAV